MPTFKGWIKGKILEEKDRIEIKVLEETGDKS